MGILATNFTRILCHGAFDERKPVGMMSPYKWRQLTHLAQHHNVLATYANGLEKYYSDDQLNIPQEEITRLKNLLQAQPRHTFADLYDIDKAHLNSRRNETQLREIVKHEFADTDRSYATTNLMALLVQNIHHLLTGQSYLRGIIDLGLFLRKDGDKVDYVKLESWLAQTHVARLANLQAGMLTGTFGFSTEEIPFASTPEAKANATLNRDLHCDTAHDLKRWEYPQGRNGFSTGMKNIMTTTRHNLALTTLAPGEVTASIGRGILKGLAEIEE